MSSLSPAGEVGEVDEVDSAAAAEPAQDNGTDQSKEHNDTNVSGE